MSSIVLSAPSERRCCPVSKLDRVRTQINFIQQDTPPSAAGITLSYHRDAKKKQEQPVEEGRRLVDRPGVRRLVKP